MIRLDSKVIYKGKVYIVTKNRDNGMFDIARKVKRQGGYLYVTGEKQSIYGDEMTEVLK